MTSSTGKVIPCIVEETVAFLSQVDGIMDLEAADIEHLAMLTQKQQWSANTEIFKELDAPDAIYFIESGKVGIWREGVQVMTLTEKMIFGEMGILDDLPRRATVRTISECECYLLPAQMIKELVDNNESLAAYFDDLINARLSSSI